MEKEHKTVKPAKVTLIYNAIQKDISKFQNAFCVAEIKMIVLYGSFWFKISICS